MRSPAQPCCSSAKYPAVHFQAPRGTCHMCMNHCSTVRIVNGPRFRKCRPPTPSTTMPNCCNSSQSYGSLCLYFCIFSSALYNPVKVDPRPRGRCVFSSLSGSRSIDKVWLRQGAAAKLESSDVMPACSARHDHQGQAGLRRPRVMARQGGPFHRRWSRVQPG